MARPQKEGLEYFPLDVDFDQDDKIVVVLGKFGIQGYGIIVRLMAAIYKNGYYYHWGTKEQYVFANRINVDINLINDVINELIHWGFFDRDLYEQKQILTSKGFQKRYIEAAKRRREITMFGGYLLVDPEQMAEKYKTAITVVNDDGKPVNVYINRSNGNATSAESTQSKVKEIESKKKVNKDLKPSPPKRVRRVYEESETPFLFAKYLRSKIMTHAEESGVAHLVERSNLQVWADDVRKLLEIDNVDPQTIKHVINWVTADEFWRKNVLSASKLRSKFAELALKAGPPRLTVVKGGGSEDAGFDPGHDPERERLDQLVRR